MIAPSPPVLDSRNRATILAHSRPGGRVTFLTPCWRRESRGALASIAARYLEKAPA
jgi:hypothetical protein